MLNLGKSYHLPRPHIVEPSIRLCAVVPYNVTESSLFFGANRKTIRTRLVCRVGVTIISTSSVPIVRDEIASHATRAGSLFTQFPVYRRNKFFLRRTRRALHVGNPNTELFTPYDQDL